jgi:hypothetical protein
MQLKDGLQLTLQSCRFIFAALNEDALFVFRFCKPSFIKSKARRATTKSRDKAMDLYLTMVPTLLTNKPTSKRLLAA